MARLILLVASGTLLLCQTLATSATLGEDDVDGSSGDSRDLAEVLPPTPFEKGSIEQKDKRFTRNVNSCGGSACQTGFVGQEQLGGAAYPPPASSYPTYDTLHSQVPYPQPGPGPYPGYQPSPADQLQSDPYAGYQPYPADQPQPGSYPAYPPSPNYQPQPEPYPVYPPSQPYQPQPEPYPAYPNPPVYQPQPEPYPVYPPSPAVQPQPFPQPYYGGYPPQPPSVIQPSPIGYMMVRYIPGQVERKYQCRQRVECGWQTHTTPGRYIYIPIPQPPAPYVGPVYPTCPPRPCGNTPQPCYRPPPIVYPQPRIIYPPTPCNGHNECNYGQQCCYQPTSNNMACNIGSARTVRSQHHLQFNSTAASRSLVELMIGDWRDSDVTSFVIDLLLPLKVDLEHEMEVILRTDPEQSGSPCDPYDTDCIGPRILSCVADMWPVVTQPQAVAWSAHINTPFRLIPPSMDYQLEAGLQEPLANSTNALVNPSEEDSWSGGEPMEVVEVDPVASANQARQVRLLSFTACLLQSFGAGVVERKKSALLTAKRCVRAYKLQWPLVRACVALHDQGGAREGRGQDSPPKRPMEITVNGELAPDLDNLKLALCQALLKVGQAPILCDLLYDELDQLQKEPGLANTGEGSTGQISYEDQDSLSLRHTDSHGLGRGWNDHGLGFSHDLPRDQIQGEADREQDSFRMEASGTQEAYGEQNHDLNLKVRNGMEYRLVPEETEERNVGYSKSRVSQSLDEVSASSPIWTGGPGNPYEV